MTSDRIRKHPGADSGKDGGIYQEIGPGEERRENYSTVPDNTILPPTTGPDAVWELIDRTPDSKR